MSALEKPIPATPGQVTAIAKDAWKRAKGDIKKAADMLLQSVSEDRSLLQALAISYLQHLDWEGEERTRSRVTIMRAVANAAAPADTSRRVVALARGNMEMLLDFPLVGGKKLRHGTKDELRRSSERYYEQGSDMVHKGKWLALVAAKVPEGKKAGDVLTEEAIRKLLEDARHAKK